MSWNGTFQNDFGHLRLRLVSELNNEYPVGSTVRRNLIAKSYIQKNKNFTSFGQSSWLNKTDRLCQSWQQLQCHICS